MQEGRYCCIFGTQCRLRKRSQSYCHHTNIINMISTTLKVLLIPSYLVPAFLLSKEWSLWYALWSACPSSYAFPFGSFTLLLPPTWKQAALALALARVIAYTGRLSWHFHFPNLQAVSPSSLSSWRTKPEFDLNQEVATPCLARNRGGAPMPARPTCSPHLCPLRDTFVDDGCGGGGWCGGET